jgi:hypothetical protein
MQPIELDDQTARNLAAQAAARGMTPAQYLSALVPQNANCGPTDSLTTELDVELESLALELPILPRDFSRADIYDEHD